MAENAPQKEKSDSNAWSLLVGASASFITTVSGMVFWRKTRDAADLELSKKILDIDALIFSESQKPTGAFTTIRSKVAGLGGERIVGEAEAIFNELRQPGVQIGGVEKFARLERVLAPSFAKTYGGVVATIGAAGAAGLGAFAAHNAYSKSAGPTCARDTLDNSFADKEEKRRQTPLLESNR